MARLFGRDLLVRHMRVSHSTNPPENSQSNDLAGIEDAEMADQIQTDPLGAVVPNIVPESPKGGFRNDSQQQHDGLFLAPPGVGAVSGTSFDAGGVPTILDGSFAGPPELFADVDSFDWLWANEASSVLMPTDLLDDALLYLGGLDQDAGALQDQHQALHEQQSVNMTTLDSSLHHGSLTAQLNNQTPISQITHGTHVHTEEDLGTSKNLEVRPRTEYAGEQTCAPTRLDDELQPTSDQGCQCVWRISVSSYERMSSVVAARTAILPPEFKMPTRQALSRYYEGYFRGFHPHLPFIHSATVCVPRLPEELFLALAACGAFYKFEHHKAQAIYFAAKALTCTSVRERRWESPGRGGHSPFAASAGGVDYSPNGDYAAMPGFIGPSDYMVHLIQTLIILTSMASWGPCSFFSDGLELAGQLAVMIRSAEVNRPDLMPQNLSWKEWIKIEDRRRTLFAGYTLLNMQSIAFNVPPGLMSQEIGLFLPHPIELWKEKSEYEWRKLRQISTHEERGFRTVLGDLLAGNEIEQPAQISAFGNLALIHGLVQQIFVERQAVGVRMREPALSPDTKSSLEASLRAWQHCWSSGHESTLDPNSSNGPIGFNSTALLRIAYIRLTVDLGPHRSVMTRDSEYLARSIARTPVSVLERSPHTDRAVLQCIHAMGILVRQGISFVSRTHWQNWSIVHSLSNIECACLLSLWLQNIAGIARQHGVSALREQERKLLAMVTSVISETSIAETIQEEQDGVARIQKLAVYSVRIWAEAIQGEHVFHVVRTIAEGLNRAADILARQLEE